MSLFVCAHGELYSKCKYCSEFDKEERDSSEDYMKTEPDELLSKIIQTMRKEKVEY